MIPQSCNVTLIGYYGADNPGDDWLEKQAVQLIYQKYPDAIISHHHASHKLKTYSHIVNSEVVVFGGGSLFQDHTSQSSLYYYVSLLLWASLWKKKIIILGHGFSKPESLLSEKLLSIALKKAHHVSVRDQESLAQCSSYGVTAILACDLAYYNAYPTPNQDIPFIIAGKYHTAVWASLRYVPFLALAYDDKLINLANELEQPYIDIRQPFTEETFKNKVEELKKNQRYYQQNIMLNLKKICERASSIW